MESRKDNDKTLNLFFTHFLFRTLICHHLFIGMTKSSPRQPINRSCIYSIVYWQQFSRDFDYWSLKQIPFSSSNFAQIPFSSLCVAQIQGSIFGLRSLGHAPQTSLIFPEINVGKSQFTPSGSLVKNRVQISRHQWNQVTRETKGKSKNVSIIRVLIIISRLSN